MKINIRNIILLMILMIIINTIFLNINILTISTESVFLFSIIGIISIKMTIKEFQKYSFSLNLVHWLFIIFFFVIAPIVQISSNFRIWNIEIAEEELIKTQIIILVWILFYIIGNKIYEKNILIIKKDCINKNNNKNSLLFLSILTIINIICSFIIIKAIGISNLFSRSTYQFDIGSSSSTTMLVYNIIKAIIVYVTAKSIIYYKNYKKYFCFFVINSILLLITCFPSGLSRNAAGSIYLGIFILMFYDKMEKFKKSYKFIIIFLLAFVIIFPALSTFRRTSFNEVNISKVIENVIDDISENYNSGDYDAFTMISQIKLYVTNHGITFGKQLLGAILFFIPRKIWHTKPTGSGYMVFESMGEKFKNVSCPLLAEGYINFGIFGTIIFALVFGYYCSKINDIYWKQVIDENERGNYLTTLYPFLIGNYFFMLRGDLMSSTSFVIPYIFIFLIFERSMLIKSNNIKKKEEQL